MAKSKAECGENIAYAEGVEMKKEISRGTFIALILIAIILGAVIGLSLALKPKCEIVRFYYELAPTGLTATVTIRNNGGSGYVEVQYFTNTGTLTTREYYIPAQSTREFNEVLWPRSPEDRWVNVTITRESLISLGIFTNLDWTLLLVTILAIAALATAFLVAAKTPSWISRRPFQTHKHCSACGYAVPPETKYCPECGRKLESLR